MMELWPAVEWQDLRERLSYSVDVVRQDGRTPAGAAAEHLASPLVTHGKAPLGCPAIDLRGNDPPEPCMHAHKGF
jgi:hypothetical protein